MAALVAVLAAGAAAGFALAAAQTNAQAAQAEAQHLLGLAQLPPDATPSATEPAGDGGQLATASGGPVVPNLVDLHEFFLAPGTATGVIAWVTAHPPAGAEFNASGGSTTETFVSFGYGPVPGVLAVRDLQIEAVPASPGEVAVRVDAQVAPLPTLPGNGRGPGKVRIVESGGELGPLGFELSCDPAGGTLPDPARVCAAIRADPTLLYSFPGPDHPCPALSPDVSLHGVWDHKPLRSSFSECTGGQEADAIKWGSLLPSQRAVASVHVDRAIGLVRLGEGEAQVLDLLRGTQAAPAPCRACTRTFPADGSVGYGQGPLQTLAWIVTFAGSRVSAIDSDGPLTVDGLGSTESLAMLGSALHGWSARTCGATEELVHRSAAGATILRDSNGYRNVVVARRLPACA
jgi:hypothetical protein